VLKKILDEDKDEDEDEDEKVGFVRKFYGWIQIDR
jgi:hypothetical protein